MTIFIVGDDLTLNDVKSRARAAVTAALVARAESDGVPPTLRAMYILKTAEARAVLSGGTSEYIDQEAAIRGVPPLALAQAIAGSARASEALELERMRLNVAVDAATSEDGVMAVLSSEGLELGSDGNPG